MQTYAQRLYRILDLAEDLLTDATDYADDMQTHEEARPIRAVQHKLEEALGPLNSAHHAAIQGKL